MSGPDPAKFHAASAAVAFVHSKMIVGLGSGTTAAVAIEILGERCRSEGLEIIGVASSEESARQARRLGIPLTDLNSCPSIDLTIDGADQVDSAFRMIKGRGGALLREKLVAAASKRRIYLVSESKRVETLGVNCPLPVEVAAFDVRHVIERIRRCGAKPRLRLDASGNPFVTDGGNALLDCDFGAISDPEGIDQTLKSTLGIFETGLFLDYCDQLIVGTETTATVIDGRRQERGIA